MAFPFGGEMTSEEKIDHLAGEVDALFAFCSALIETHPDLKRLTLAWTGSSEFQEAGTLPAPVPESFRAGQHKTRWRIVALLAAWESRRA